VRPLLRKAVSPVREWLRARGYDVVRYPPFGGDLISLVSQRKIDCVLDVGAFQGTTGRLLRDLGYRGRIVSFEPAQANFDHLVRESRDDSEWEVHRVGLGSESGTRELRLLSSSGSNSFLQPNELALEQLPDQFAERGSEVTEVTTLDDVFAAATASCENVFLKIDTQGWDVEVVRGARKSLSRVALLQIELAFQQTYHGQPHYIEVLAELASLGFQPAYIYPTYRVRSGLIAEADCILLPA
jgi:FkbM family methyltransferase